MTKGETMKDGIGKKSSPVLVGAAWLLVLLPAAWGLRYTVENALKIFTKQPVPVASGVKPS